jgi:photosystem II stability/assembly factor-like uncharacterized protein
MKIYPLAFLLLFQFPFAGTEAVEFRASSPVTDGGQKPTRNESGAANIVFKSTDGGQTWQDISEGLPEALHRNGFFANERGLYVRAGNEVYHSEPNATAPFWKKESLPDGHRSIAPARNGIFAYNYLEGQFLQKINGTNVWLPMYTSFQSIWSPKYTDFQEKQIRTVFETAGGTVFIGTDNGLFKSTTSGRTWKQVHTGDWVMKLVESNGVLLATSQKGILRSTNGGESWDCVISEGGVGIAVERINGGFAAITCNAASETRRVRTSYDGGKTWQPIDAGLPASLLIASITEVGEYFFCGHPSGIFRSSDKGKTWQLLLPAIENKVFYLSVSGNVIYAIPREGGC